MPKILLYADKRHTGDQPIRYKDQLSVNLKASDIDNKKQRASVADR